MKERIVHAAIASLQAEGLRFSVDLLAKRLCISKKTIYQYFASKEELAREIYLTFYRDITAKAERAIALQESTMRTELLSLYYQSYRLTRREIFNKYALNENLRLDALSGHTRFWELIRPAVTAREPELFRLIADGAFENGLQTGTYPYRKTIERLVEMV